MRSSFNIGMFSALLVERVAVPPYPDEPLCHMAAMVPSGRAGAVDRLLSSIEDGLR